MKQKVGYERKKAKQLDSLQDTLSKIINKAQTTGPQTVSVSQNNKYTIQIIEERLKQSDIPLKYEDKNNVRLYHIVGQYEGKKQIDDLADAMGTNLDYMIAEIFRD